MGAVKAVIIHSGQAPSHFSERINQFHVELIQRNLSQDSLEETEKMEVVNRVASHLKMRETDGVIQ